MRTMDLTDLHIFRSVVQAGGVTRAAEKLNRVQSNVTTRVRQLESDLGVELFVREGKRLHLSSEGKLLLDYADRLLDLAEEAREAVHDAEPRGLLRLGTGESTAAMRLPVPMNDYLGRYPDVTLELRTGNTRELAAAVLGGDLDAALISEPIADAPFDQVAARRQAANRARVRIRLLLPPAARGLVRPSRRNARPHRRNHLLPRHARMRGGGHGHFADAAQRAHHLSGRQAVERALIAAGARPRANLPDPAQRHARAEGERADRGSARAHRHGQKTARGARQRAGRSQPRLTAAPGVKSSDCT